MITCLELDRNFASNWPNVGRHRRSKSRGTRAERHRGLEVGRSTPGTQCELTRNSLALGRNSFGTRSELGQKRHWNAPVAPDAAGTRSELNRKRARNLTGTSPWITRNSVGTNTHSRLELARNSVGARSSRGTWPIRPRSELAQNIARKRGRNPNRGTEHARN